ncbi:type III-B CRISPR module RAMP protein Cmr1 [Meiothermus granaticius]|uniref:type III-B CRISPR module RAMP protein Cmr1 n=1 Tax=Meiothermus granaticius TaxID=863370 RepID=UPI0014752FAA|nr:type III-B CRISPR module RAMP protein Cmr1 [Meiothermus granaticius]
MSEEFSPVLSQGEYFQEVRKYKLLTPLIGAGSTPFVNDTQMPIRGGTIRGVLRFWWRATCGNRFGNLEKMRAAEEAIWGSTDKASLIDVYVDIKPSDESKLKPSHQKKDKPDGSVIPAYISWPLNPPKEKPNDIKKVLLGVEFALRFRFPPKVADRDFREEIRLTLWAFDFFGGVGARTRRGAGAVFRIDDEGKPYYTKADMEWGWPHIRSNTWPDGVPYINTTLRAKLITAPWLKLVNIHKTFFSEQFSKVNRFQNLDAAKMKRTALGAPFKWKQVKVDERLASPIIYRPIRLKEGDFSVVVVLQNLGKQSPKANPSLIKGFFDTLGGTQ